MGLNRDEVNALEISAATALRSVGLPVHEEVEGNLHALCQGMQFDGENQMVRVSSERRSKLQQGIHAFVRRPRCRPSELRVIVGHLVFAFLLRRPLLSILRHVYKFIMLPDTPQRLWHCVRKELEVAACLLLFAESAMSVSDSSSFAWAAHETDWDIKKVVDCINWNERWRFEDPSAVGARSHAQTQVRPLLQLSPQVLPQPLPEGSQDVVDFPEVSFPWIENSTWRSLNAKQWHNMSEPIHIKESRASLWGLRRITRSKNSAGHIHLFLTDSLGNALAVEKGRCGDPKMLNLLRRWSAYCIAGSCRVRMRWIPSEVNPSDAESRMKDTVSHHSHTLQHKWLQHDPTLDDTVPQTRCPSPVPSISSACSPPGLQPPSVTACAATDGALDAPPPPPARAPHRQGQGTTDAEEEGSQAALASDDAQPLDGREGRHGDVGAPRAAHGVGSRQGFAGPPPPPRDRRSFVVREQLGLGTDPGRLPAPGDGVQSVLYQPGLLLGDRRGDAIKPRGVLHSVLLGGRLGGHRGQALGGSELPVVLVRDIAVGKASAGRQGLERLASSSANDPEVATAMARDLWLGSRHVRPRQGRHGPRTHPCDGRVHEARRSAHPSRTLGPLANDWRHGHHGRVVPHCLRLRARSLIKSGQLQRLHRARSSQAAVARHLARQAGEAGGAARAALRLQLPRMGHNGEGRSRAGGPGCVQSYVVHGEAPGPVDRRRGEDAHTRRSANARPLGFGHFGAPLRKAQPAHEAVAHAQREGPAVLAQRAGAHSQLARQQCGGPNTHALKRLRDTARRLGVPSCLRDRIFVEVFAGCGRMSRAAAAQGFTVVAWDILYSTSHDLTFRRNRVMLLRLCLSAAYVHLGIPCDTFSRARRNDGRGPPPCEVMNSSKPYLASLAKTWAKFRSAML